MLHFIQVITTQNAIFDANCQLKRHQLPTVTINCVNHFLLSHRMILRVAVVRDFIVNFLYSLYKLLQKRKYSYLAIETF